VRLGRTQVVVTKLALGTAPLGGLYSPVDEVDALAVIEGSWSEGLRFFDTAPLYGHGLAEERVGEVLRRKPRDGYTLATKVGRLLRAGVPPEPRQAYAGTPPVNPTFDFSYDGVMRSIEESHERTGIERFDILHIHDPDDHYEEALHGAYRALEKLRSEGAISAVGAGMNQAEMLTRFARDADFDCFLLAGRYTLLDQIALNELLPTCLERGIAVIAGGVFNSGILADPRTGTHYNYRRASRKLIDRANRLRAVCDRHGVPLRAAAIQFPLGHPAVQTVLVGCRSLTELQDAILMFEVDISPELWIDMKTQGLLPQEVPVPA
jgi:D-threo-aldose 1-dehydrogenase